MKVALVHDYLAQDGGAERVLAALHEIWPEAPIFVLFHDEKKIPGFEKHLIHESWLSKMPGIKQYYQWYLPLMPRATESFNLYDFDLIISSTSAFAKGIIIHPRALHISYCHTPTRYLWSNTHEYIADLRSNFFIKWLIPHLIFRLRLWDKMSADRVDHFIANSFTVKDRIHKYYRRDSEVIYPPVDTDNFFISSQIENYFVAGGRLVPYKRLDLVVKAFNRLGYPLKIFGHGPEYAALKKIAKNNIQFLGRVSDTEKAELLSRAQAFIYPQTEDFGITAVESLASGRPVIAYRAGGATETLREHESAVFFHEQSWEAILDAVLHFESSGWDSQKIREQSLKFNKNHFKTRITQHINEKYEHFTQDFVRS